MIRVVRSAEARRHVPGAEIWLGMRTPGTEVPERVDAIMEEIRGPAGRNMWEKLSNVQEDVLANYLKNEYPQTVAVVLSKIKPDHASRVLTSLPEDFALECVQRMLRMEPVQREILDKIEQTLRIEFMSNLARTSKRDSHEMMADIFNSFDRQTEARFIGALEERNREAAERIRALMFVFEDLGKLDPGGVQTLLRAVEKDQLALALKGRWRRPQAGWHQKSSQIGLMQAMDHGTLTEGSGLVSCRSQCAVKAVRQIKLQLIDADPSRTDNMMLFSVKTTSFQIEHQKMRLARQQLT